MTSGLRRILARKTKSSTSPEVRFTRPLIVFQSDDWGRVGVRDRVGWDELKGGGLNLGERPYDFYSLETPDDLQALSEVLKKHRDSRGRYPCIGMNFVTANVNFTRCVERGVQEIPLKPLTEGLPAPWERPGLIDAYHQGIRECLFFPALHGLTHFCAAAVTRELKQEGERRRLQQTLWRAGTPYIHWRMPWIGYEYWDPGLPPDQRFLSLSDQRVAIQRAAEIFRALFALGPLSACAPGYRANQDTRTAWFEAEVRVVQGGPGGRMGPSLDRNGTLLTFRNVEIETATALCDLRSTVKRANDCLARGLPAIISMHAINFHSSLRDFRTPTLALLDEFLTAMEKEWPNLLYVHDGELWQIATQGFLHGESENIMVGAKAEHE
jgi:hypothetical protein